MEKRKMIIPNCHMLAKTLRKLPEDVQMGLFALIAVPLLFLILALAHVTSPVTVTPDILPGAFYADGALRVALFYKITALMAGITIGLFRGGRGGSMGFLIVAFAQAGLVHLIN